MGPFCFKFLEVLRLVDPLALFCVSCSLGVNPFVGLVLWLSDGPKFSVTRICADDFGSALKFPKVLKRQASIFRLAASCAGLHLKPAKCFLIVSHAI